MNPVQTALQLIITGNREVFFVVGTSLQFALLSTLFAGVPSLVLATLLTLYRFPFRRLIVSLITALMAVPTVVIGLVVYTVLSRSGPLGSLGWLFTPRAVVLGQSILALPIITSYLLTGFSRLDPRFFETLYTLGLPGIWKWILTWRESGSVLAISFLSSFGRVLSEVGVSMMLGGNIRFYTRTMTTAIALETSRGEYEFALALGMILLVLAVGLNLFVHRMVQDER
jgi:tungstate transport system permease protein